MPVWANDRGVRTGLEDPVNPGDSIFYVERRVTLGFGAEQPIEHQRFWVAMRGTEVKNLGCAYRSAMPAFTWQSADAARRGDGYITSAVLASVLNNPVQLDWARKKR